jgi:histidinol-phosphate aminotransferase
MTMPNVPNDMLALAVPGVQRLKPYEPGKPITELQRELGIDDIVKLASNENPLGPGPMALAAIQRHLSELALYPDGAGYELKRALATRYNLDPACITLGNGSNDVLDIIGRAFLDVNTSAVFAEHAFAVYPIVTTAVGAKAHVAKANSADAEQPYGHNLQALADAIADDTRVVFIANPNNPTGTWLTHNALKAFIAQVPSRVLVVLDEAYIEYAERDDIPDGSQWLREFPNLIVTRTFSKAYGLAALRVGYALSHPHVAGILNRVRQPFNVNSLGQAAAVAALFDAEHLRRSREVNSEGLRQLEAAFKARGLFYIPSIGNFISFRVPAGFSAAEVYQSLLHEGVIVRPIENYGLPGFLRVSIGTVAQLTRFITALDAVLASREEDA